MARKKKVVEDKIIKPEVPIEITEEDIKKVKEEIEKNNSLNIGEFGEKIEKKSKKKWYLECGRFWDCQRIVLRIDDKDYTKTYDNPVSISKDKLGTLTKYGKDKWGKIVEIRETETDLIFTLVPINI